MQKRNGRVYYSASDLVNYLECEHLTTLDRINLETPLPRTEDDEQARLIQDKGYAHEEGFLKQLQVRHAHVVDLSANSTLPLDAQVAATQRAMQAGSEIIFQATLADGELVGHADFLRKVSRPSALGDWSYEVLDTKLARSPKAKFVVQLGFYAALLTQAQGIAPRQMHVVLGSGEELPYRCADYAHYLERITAQFLACVHGKITETYPEPCDKCSQCRWRGLCDERRLKDDHLSQVAGITKVQIRKLEAAGVITLAALATLAPDTTIPRINPDTQARLANQARLQHQARQTGQRHVEQLPAVAGELRGFGRMPRPDAGDLFFDMEGDPLEDGGLEYLFGLYYFDNGEPSFKPFWAHSRAEEKRAFEAFMDFVTDWLQTHPHAHIYHYANYERAALKRLMLLHGTREAEVDNLLRTHKLVDLYKVVREGIRVSEPGYSIKNIEHFYLDQRSGEVTNAGASIVFYERWKETGNPQLLEDIARYNFDDVRSTYLLQQWLLTLRPDDMPWADIHWHGDDAAKATPGQLNEAERRLVPYRNTLVASLPEDRTRWTRRDHLAELTCQLLDFHRRAAKPAWWELFARTEKTEEELLEDGECLAGLTPDPAFPPEQVRRSMRYTYRYPEQDFKLRTGASATIAQTGVGVNELIIDEDARRVSFKLGPRKEAPTLPLALGPGQPVSSKELINAVFRFADSLIAGDDHYPAIESILTHALPRVTGIQPGAPLLTEGADDLPAIIETIDALDHSCVFVQGPPGAGKTYTGSHVIVALLKRGCRVGISSNSHKAINNLLAGVVKVAQQQNVRFRGVKKSSQNNPDSSFDGDGIQDVRDNEEILVNLSGPMAFQLIAGTAWLFADPGMDQQLDYLFVDEAGQVALANLVAMGTSARNIVLLGDQMQLGQPIQGVHPGRSGESSLEYLLNGQATIPPEQGIFLHRTWRMHPDVCRFISDAVYDSRLEPEAHNATQTLLLGEGAHPALAPTGIRYLPIEHQGCSQRSQEEAEFVSELVANLLHQRYRDKHGVEHPMTLNDILVVAPYNMQVNLLKRTLPEGARVGTVDKFQGQEAEVVIVSMATSSGEDLPRHIEFLYSKNRLNVAISRAKCLALLIANPALMTIRCSTPEEMGLVNTLCWISSPG